MSTPQMRCPKCRTEMQYLTTLQMGEYKEGAYHEREVLDVAHCPVCNRRYYRDRATATFKPPTWEPICPECGMPAVHREDEQPSVAGGVVFACVTHASRRWLWHEGDTWTALPDRRHEEATASRTVTPT